MIIFFIGYDAGGGSWQTAVSNYNVGIGNYALDGALDGALNNVAMGYHALGALEEGDDNTAIGAFAGDGIVDSAANVAVGYNSLGVSCGNNNVAIGHTAMTANTGEENTAVGRRAMYTSQAVDKCVAIGMDALYLANTNTADGTVAIGYGAGESYVPTANGDASGGTTLIGYNAGNDDGSVSHGLTTRLRNTAVGHETLGANANAALTGSDNCVAGYRAGYGLTGVGASNTLIGALAGDAVTTGGGNTAVGYSTDNAAASNYQTAIGSYAVTQNNYETRLGYGGGFQVYSINQTVAYSDATHTTVAQPAYLFKIPARSIIKSITAVVLTLSSNNVAEFNIVRSTDSGVSAEGEALTGTTTEILGAGATGTTNTGGFNSGGVNDIVCDIASQHGIINAVWHNDTVATLNPNDASTSSDSYIWVLNAIDNGDSNPSTAPVIKVCIEFAGQD